MTYQVRLRESFKSIPLDERCLCDTGQSIKTVQDFVCQVIFTVDGSEIRLTIWHGLNIHRFNSVSYITGGTGFLPSTRSFPFLAHCPFQGDVANEMASRFASSKSNGEYVDLDTFLFEGCPTLRRLGKMGKIKKWFGSLQILKASFAGLRVLFAFSLLTEISRISYQETLRWDRKQPQQRNRNHPISSITTQKLNRNPRWAPSLYSYMGPLQLCNLCMGISTTRGL